MNRFRTEFVACYMLARFCGRSRLRSVVRGASMAWSLARARAIGR